MKPKELPRKSPSHISFSAMKHTLPRFLNVWHYHEEIELVYIKESTGTKFIGDSIHKFQPGDLVLIGSQVPHLWLNDKDYFNSNDLTAEAWVIHFHPNCLGENFFHVPELRKIERLLQQSRAGLEIHGASNDRIADLILKAMKDDNPDKIVALLQILGLIADETDKRELSSLSFITSHANVSGSKLDKVYEYIFHNFKDSIDLETAAELARMNPSSFSRYFGKMTNKTFTTFVNEVRIGFACKLILEQDCLNIAEIGFESGYNNLSNFNKQFKLIMGMTPTEYYNSHLPALQLADSH